MKSKLTMAIAGLCSASILNTSFLSIGAAILAAPATATQCNGVHPDTGKISPDANCYSPPVKTISPIVCPVGSTCVTTLTSAGYTTPNPHTTSQLPLPTAYPIPTNWGTSQTTIWYYLGANAAEIAEQQTGTALNGAISVFQQQYPTLAALSRDITNPAIVSNAAYYTAQFLAQVASKASANSLHILESAFGPTLIAAALAYAPAATQAAYNAQAPYAALVGSYYWISLGNRYNPAPIDMSPMDIAALQTLSGGGEPAATTQRKVVIYMQKNLHAGTVDIVLWFAAMAFAYYAWTNPEAGPALQKWLENNGPDWAPGVSPGDMPDIIQVPDAFPSQWPATAPPDSAPEPFPTEGICYETDGGQVSC